MKEGLLFLENQYMGRDKVWISVRLVLALFCFTAGYLNFEHELSRQLFFMVGCAVMIASIVMMYMLLFRTEVFSDYILMSGLWSTRLVKIDLASIVSVEKVNYSKFFFNNPVYNLHRSGSIKFYAGGQYAIKLTDKEGLVYLIGTHRPDEFLRAVQEAKSLLKNS